MHKDIQHKLATSSNSTPIIYDAHACPPFASDKDLSALKRYKDSGVTFVSINVGFGDMTDLEIIPIVERFRDYILAHTNDYHLVNSAEDIIRCKIENKLGVAFDLEGANAICSNIEMLDRYKQLGVKQLLLAYNKNNSAGGGCQDYDTVLTTLGKNIIRRMNDIGIIIDCSHTGYKTTFDIMAHSTQPVVFSHSNPYALCAHPRNITDEQIKACAQTGGVIGINGISIFLGCKEPTISRLAEHIDYVSQLVGSEHVGLGLDYVLDHNDAKSLIKANPALFPADHKYDAVELLPPEQIQNISTILKDKGYNNSDVQAILGGNFLRIAKQVWGE